MSGSYVLLPVDPARLPAALPGYVAGLTQGWSFAWRSGVLTIVTSLWWLDGLAIQGRYGLPVIRYTETYRTVATVSSAPEVLRGLTIDVPPGETHAIVGATGNVFLPAAVVYTALHYEVMSVRFAVTRASLS